MCAHGLLELALVTGEVSYATAARRLIDSTLATTTDLPTDIATEPSGANPAPFNIPNGPDPVLVAHGVTIGVDPSEGAYPSGLTATADAAYLLYLLTADLRYRETAEAAMALVAPLAPARPLAFGAALRLMSSLSAPVEQLVVVSPNDIQADPTGLLAAARRHADGLVASVTARQAGAWTDAGFELFADRTPLDNLPTAYLCRDFVCRLPVTDPADLADLASEFDGDSARDAS